MTPLVKYKKALLNYEVLDRFEAGIELLGFEVKSIRDSKASLDGSFVKIRGNEAYLVNAYIAPFQPANTPQGYDPYRPRRLLFTKKELTMLAGKEKEKRLTLVPISMYNKGRNIKVEVAIVQGKKKFDKRESIKKKDVNRDIEREFKKRIR